MSFFKLANKSKVTKKFVSELMVNITISFFNVAHNYNNNNNNNIIERNQKKKNHLPLSTKTQLNPQNTLHADTSIAINCTIKYDRKLLSTEKKSI